MATTKSLDEAIKEVQSRHAERTPLLDFSANNKELSEIAEAAQDYVVELNEELAKPKPWEVVVRMTMEVLKATFKYLNARKSTDYKEVYIQFGTLMTISIEYAETKSGDKTGTFNPSIRVGRDLAYDSREDGYNDAMSNDMAQDLQEENMPYLHPMFYDVRDQMKEIFDTASANMFSKFHVRILNPESLSYVVVAFFRKTKEYLIEHKDDGDGYGISVALGRLITMGIEKQADGDYFIYITPNQIFKMDNAKGDEVTEKE